MNILVIALIIALVACVAYIFKLKTGGVSCLEAELQARIKTLEEEYEVLKQKYAILHSAATNVNDANKSYEVSNNEIGDLTQKLYDQLTGIQWGKVEDKFGWVEFVCRG